MPALKKAGMEAATFARTDIDHFFVGQPLDASQQCWEQAHTREASATFSEWSEILLQISLDMRWATCCPAVRGMLRRSLSQHLSEQRYSS